MRFNANREGRLAFGDLVEDYDLGRRRLDAAFVREVRHRLEESSGDESGGRRSPARQVLEVGAGTGQLTVGLLDSGDVVTAVEQDDLAAGVRRAAVFVRADRADGPGGGGSTAGGDPGPVGSARADRAELAAVRGVRAVQRRR